MNNPVAHLLYIFISFYIFENEISKNMKTKIEIKEKEFDTVKTFRAIKEKISLEMSNMNFEQIKAYLKENSKKLQAK